MAQTICLNMIVKDEAHVIERCLESAKPHIDTWVIVDTGSTDGTQDVVRTCMNGIPGELHERPWRSFEHNRNEALELARGKADYVMIIDADDVFVSDPAFVMPALTQDSYQLFHECGETSFYRTQIFRNGAGFHYKGVIHEALIGPNSPPAARLEGLAVRIVSDGARNQDKQRKFKDDARILERAVRDEPDNARYAFYLAQSYRDSGQVQKSIRAYKRRVAMGGWDEEVWYALYQIAVLQEARKENFAPVLQAYLDAYQFRPQRAEPLGALARHYRLSGEHNLAYLFASMAHATPRPDDVLFVDDPLYAWRAADELAIACYWTGRYQLSIDTYRALFDSGHVPAQERPRLISNLNFSLVAMGLPEMPAETPEQRVTRP